MLKNSTIRVIVGLDTFREPEPVAAPKSARLFRSQKLLPVTPKPEHESIQVTLNYDKEAQELLEELNLRLKRHGRMFTKTLKDLDLAQSKESQQRLLN